MSCSDNEAKLEVMFLLTDGKQHKARELDVITLRNHAPRSYMTCLERKNINKVGSFSALFFMFTLTWITEKELERVY